MQSEIFCRNGDFMNNPIYNSISALGTLVTNLVTGAIRFYRRYILFGIKNI